ncbi:hypothetical protein WBG06_18280 [Nocardioides sp. CCNWLW239]|uniref:hypothetical protein n=1 Tax=Nocardioides sp. CCNWLW239 TaxID=3128902 RepID=UPI003019C4B0
MPSRRLSRPPRPLALGDIVVAPSELLGEWTAAQVTGFREEWKYVCLLDLDWSGPEPTSLEDLGEIRPLRLTHHHDEGLSDCHFEWVLPRSHRVLGNVPPLAPPGETFSHGWRLGDQLHYQRLWDDGVKEWSDPARLNVTGAELEDLLASNGTTRLDVRTLWVHGIELTDAGRLVEVFPNVRALRIWGALGSLTNAGSLNHLASLRTLELYDTFGMTAADCLDPSQSTEMEHIELHSVPVDYAKAMRARWRGEAVNGTYTEIRSPRTPDWVEANRNNPLRDWDGRPHISAAAYKKSVAQLETTRSAIETELQAWSEEHSIAEMTRIGVDFGKAFNRLTARNPWIETEERDELCEAMVSVASRLAEAAGMADRRSEITVALLAGVGSVRDW